MTKVGLFIDTFNMGGAESIVINLAQKLKVDGEFNPVVIHFGSDVLKSHCDEYGIDTLIAPGYKYFKKTVTLPVFAYLFRKKLSESNIQILHSHLFGAIVASALTAAFPGINHIGTLHDIYMIEEKPSRILLLKLACLLGTKLVAVSNNMLKYYIEQHGISKRCMQLIYNGIEINRNIQSGDFQLRNILGLNKQEIIITCVARLVKLKRHDILLRSLLLLDRKNVKLLIVGDGPEESKLKRLVDENGLSNMVLFLGNRGDVDEILGISDIFILTSDTEGLSCSILEAMSHGLPVIATDVGGNHELIHPEENGFLVKPGDVSAITEKLQILIDDEQFRTMLGKKSIKHILDRFRWTSTFEKYKSLYGMSS